MDPIALLICAAIALGAAWAVAQPLLSGSADTSAAAGGVTAEDRARLLTVEKEILYQSIHELDLDYAAGKLSEADYQALRARQEAQAVEILKALDAAPPVPKSPTPSSPSAHD